MIMILICKPKQLESTKHINNPRSINNEDQWLITIGDKCVGAHNEQVFMFRFKQ